LVRKDRMGVEVLIVISMITGVYVIGSILLIRKPGMNNLNKLQ
jgi:hypothetical protein